MIRVALWGASGQMGTAIKELLSLPTYSNTFFLAGEISSQNSSPSTQNNSTQNTFLNCDLVMDFSNAQGNHALLLALDNLDKLSSPPKHTLSVLIGSTGLSQDHITKAKALTQKHQLSTLIAPNTSLGIFVLYQTLKQSMTALGEQNFDIEIVETHHKRKRDVPSGTANLLLSAVHSHPNHNQGHGTHDSGKPRKEGYVGMHAIRGGGIYGDHSVRFICEDEEITFNHRALSRKLFARGALFLGEKLTKLPAGFHNYKDLTLQDLS